MSRNGWLDRDDLNTLERVRHSQLFFRPLLKIGMRFSLVLVREERPYRSRAASGENDERETSQ